ncbi:MAG: hypothetical protein H0V78_09910, partial [Burkholderiales bacterium]|nr:hypothetical protein [Burkholderiales bacterium]
MLDSLLSAKITLPASLALALLVVVIMLALVIWSVKRHRDPKLDVECGQPLDELIPSLSGLTHSTRVEGNTVEIFENGAYFDALFEEIASARRSVHFETYLWQEGKLGDRLAETLAERARAGVKVRVLLDASGCKKMGEAACHKLEEAGCKVARYHAPRLRNIGVLNRRDHRKLAVLDGRVALAGGHCIVDTWLGQAQDKEHFRDISVRLRGPIVHAVQSAFSENWVDETGELFVGDDVFPRLDAAGDITMHVARVKPERAAPAVKILHHLVLCVARHK